MQPVESGQIRLFLKENFHLPEEHIETMLASIRDSLNLEFANAGRGLVANDKEILWKAAHSIKGALLNAGAGDWAKLAKEIELSARAAEDLDYETLFAELKSGMTGIL